MAKLTRHITRRKRREDVLRQSEAMAWTLLNIPSAAIMLLDTKANLIEVNEAFAAQYIACEKLLDLNRDIVNVNGSGISLGHPVGCTGARITVTLLYEMIKRNSRRGLATLCGMGGVATGVLLER